MTYFALPILALLAICSTASASDALEPLTIKYYDVSGTNAQKVRESLDDLRPTDPSGARYDGYTEWNVKWTFQLAKEGKVCKVKEFKTILEASMTMPRWNKPERVSKQLEDQWQKYAAALKHHEDGHYSIALASTEQLRQRISTLTSSSGCPTLSSEVNTVAKATLAEFKKKNADYDLMTEHGMKQGAVFP